MMSRFMVVGLSRVYPGLHYPTDVVAGAAEAILWLTVSITVVERLGIDLRWPSRMNGSA